MKEPQRDTTKRQRFTKQKQESLDTPDSEKKRVEQSRGADRPSMSTTTGSSVSGLSSDSSTKTNPAKPMAQAYPSAETEPSARKPASSQEAGKSAGADHATPEPSAPASQRHVHHERIAQRAYALYVASGYTGDAIQHWLEAERELRDQNDDGERDKGA